MTFCVPHPTKPEIAFRSGVILSFEASKSLLDAMNTVLSPVPMKPWPGFLGSVEETTAERADLHSALVEIQGRAK